MNNYFAAALVSSLCFGLLMANPVSTRAQLNEGSPPTLCDGQQATLIVPLGGAYFRGTPGPDVIIGTPGPDHIDGRAGNDIICALGGDDIVEGGLGIDRIFGVMVTINSRVGSGQMSYMAVRVMTPLTEAMAMTTFGGDRVSTTSVAAADMIGYQETKAIISLTAGLEMIRYGD